MNACLTSLEWVIIIMLAYSVLDQKDRRYCEPSIYFNQVTEIFFFNYDNTLPMKVQQFFLWWKREGRRKRGERGGGKY